MPSDPSRLRDDLDALDREQPSGRYGLAMAQRRAEVLDEALRRMFVDAGSPADIAVCAIGGYGRGRLLPHSDVDLLIVHDEAQPLSEVEALTARLLYPLWDAGLEVGQAVRTPKGCVAIAEERLDALTAMLDLRHLAGASERSAAARAGVLALVSGDPTGFALRLREAAGERHARYGSSAHSLEPELKEGEGGARDESSLGWLAAAFEGSSAIRLRPREQASLDDAAEFLTRVRTALHLEAAKRTDRLLREYQTPIALAMGFEDQPRLPAEDGLMRAVFGSARQVAYITRSVFRRALGETEAPVSANAAPGAGDALDEAGVLEALADAAPGGVLASTAVLDAVEAANVPDPVTWTPDVRAAFLRLLGTGAAGVDAIEALDHLGVLTRYLPAWDEVRCRPQRDPYHRFTVDTHLTQALREMDRMLVGGGDDEDPVEEESRAQLFDLDGVRLGALLHDIGKVGAGGHVAIGAEVAAQTLDHMGVSPPSRDLARFMVAEHLLLPDTATRRDLSDENLIMDIAARVGSPERLSALYLLAKADALATGPAAWTSWRRSLLRELVVKVQRVFDRGDMGSELAGRLTERVERLRQMLAAEPEAEVERFVLRMPRGYFLAVEPGDAARHFPTIGPPVGRLDVRTAVWPAQGGGAYELLVVAADRPGLLSWIAGALSLAGLSILTAQAFTTDDGVAADRFEVAGVFEAEVTERRWREFRSQLRQAIEGSSSLAMRVAEKRAYYPPQGDAPVTVAIDNDASDFATVIEVGAPDRVGLLYDITSALAELQLDVHLAKVTTYTARVIDAFYVCDSLGRKIVDPAQLGEIGAVVRQRLGT